MRKTVFKYRGTKYYVIGISTTIYAESYEEAQDILNNISLESDSYNTLEAYSKDSNLDIEGIFVEEEDNYDPDVDEIGIYEEISDKATLEELKDLLKEVPVDVSYARDRITTAFHVDELISEEDYDDLMDRLEEIRYSQS